MFFENISDPSIIFPVSSGGLRGKGREKEECWRVNESEKSKYELCIFIFFIFRMSVLLPFFISRSR